MSELVAKPIAVTEVVGFARALPTLRNRVVMIRIKETLNSGLPTGLREPERDDDRRIIGWSRSCEQGLMLPSCQ